MNVGVKCDLNPRLEAFLRATEDRGDDERLTLQDNKIKVTADDVGVLSRTVRPKTNEWQIQANNDVRTALLDALSDQFGGRNEIPPSVRKALTGSSWRGKSDMSEDGGVLVNSGRPLTVRRVRAVIGQVLMKLTNQALPQEKPLIKKPNSQPEKNANPKVQPNGQPKELPKAPTTTVNRLNSGNEPLPLDMGTISGFKRGMSPIELNALESLIKADSSTIGDASKWFNAYARQTVERVRTNASFMNLLLNGKDPAAVTMLGEALNGSSYISDRVRRIIDESISHGKNHAAVQKDVEKFISDFFEGFCKTLGSVKGKKSKGQIEPQECRAPDGLHDARELNSGDVLSQGANTCPIIGLTNAMLMTSDETVEKVRSFMTLHQENDRSYFEFPHPDGKGGNIRVHTDEFAKMFPDNSAVLSDFEKAVFVAMKRANFVIKNADQTETQPGEPFEISPVFVLFGFKEPVAIGNRKKPSKMQQCVDGQKIAEAINARKPCVLRKPGHFMGIQGVKFDNEGLPTYICFDSSTHDLLEIGPNDNSGFQFYIGEKADGVK